MTSALSSFFATSFWKWTVFAARFFWDFLKPFWILVALLLVAGIVVAIVKPQYPFKKLENKNGEK